MSEYVFPAVPIDFFEPLPSGLELDTAPGDYDFEPYKLPGFGSPVRQELASRLLAAYVHHGVWSALRTFGLLDATMGEYIFRQRDKLNSGLPDSVLDINGPSVMFTMIRDFIREGILGTDFAPTLDTLVWPTAKFIGLLAPHRRA